MSALGRALLVLPPAEGAPTPASSAGSWVLLPTGGGGAGGGGPSPSDGPPPAVRALRFSRDGRRLVVAGEDRCVRLWAAEAGGAPAEPPRLLGAARLPKRASAACFAGDTVLAADKFGDLHALESSEAPGPGGDWAPRLVGGVYATIVTDLASSPSGALAAGVDRGGRVRVFQVGAPWEIQCYCFGHVGFALCVAFVGDSMVASGGADGTVRLWDAREGRQLGCYNVRGAADGEIGGDGGAAAVVSLASDPSSEGGRRLAAVLEGSRRVTLLEAAPSGLASAGGEAPSWPRWARVLSAAFDGTGQLWACGALLDGRVAVETVGATPGGPDELDAPLARGLAALNAALRADGGAEVLAEGPQVAPELRLGLGADAGADADADAEAA